MTEDDLPQHAKNLLERLRNRRFYPVYGARPTTPKTMELLVKHGFVKQAIRVIELKQCYVPTEFIPHVPEQYPSKKGGDE